MLNRRNLFYGVGATLLLVAVVVAQSYHTADSVAVPFETPDDSKPSMNRVRGAYVVRERDGEIDVPGDSGTLPLDAPRPSMRRSGPPEGPSAPSRSEHPVQERRRESNSDESWFSGIAAMLANALTLGGSAPAPADNATPATLSEVPAGSQIEVRAILFSDRPETACLPGTLEFTLEDTSGIWVCVVWAGLAGTYAQQLTFESPDGHVYVTLTSAFGTAPGASGGTLEFQGTAYDVKPAGWGANGATLVGATLPVAGTYITQHNLAGLWTVKVALNGQLMAQDTFELLSNE